MPSPYSCLQALGTPHCLFDLISWYFCPHSLCPARLLLCSWTPPWNALSHTSLCPAPLPPSSLGSGTAFSGSILWCRFPLAVLAVLRSALRLPYHFWANDLIYLLSRFIVQLYTLVLLTDVPNCLESCLALGGVFIQPASGFHGGMSLRYLGFFFLPHMTWWLLSSVPGI